MARRRRRYTYNPVTGRVEPDRSAPKPQAKSSQAFRTDAADREPPSKPLARPSRRVPEARDARIPSPTPREQRNARRDAHESAQHAALKAEVRRRAAGFGVQGPIYRSGAVPGSGIVGNALREARDIVTGLPKAGFLMAKDTAENLGEGAPLPVAIGQAFADPQVEYYKHKYGPLLTGDVETFRERASETPISTALDVFGGASVLKGSVVRAGRASAALGEGASLREAYQASKRMHVDELRSLTYKDLTVRPRTSSNPLMASAERFQDRLAEALAQRDIGGRVVPTAISAPKRALKVASRNITQEAKRQKAALAHRARVVKHIKGEQRTAAYWEHQLPDEVKGGVGLRMIADDQRRLADYWQNEAPRAYTDRLAQIKKELNEVPEGSPDFYDLLRERAYLEHDFQFIPEYARNTREQAARIDKAIGGKPVDPVDLEAMGDLISERERILADAGFDYADDAGVLARALGLEPGGERYITHTAERPRKVLDRLPGLVHIGGGKTRLPKGVGRENELRLYETGRLRVDPDVAIEAWQDALHFEGVNRVKDIAGKIGEPIVGRPNDGWFIVNTQGHKLPRQWKDAPLDEQALKAGFGDDVERLLAEDLTEYANNVIARAGTPYAETLMKKANPEDLRQVPPELMRRFEDDYLGPQGRAGRLGLFEEGLDAGADLVRFSVLYANPATYIGANVIGNALFALVDQGPVFLPANLWRGMKIVSPKTRDPQFRNMLLAEVGHGPAGALVSGARNPLSRGINWVAQKEGRVADDVLRVAAWEHHARKAGFRTKAQQKALLLDKSEAGRTRLNQIKGDVDASMGDFDLLGPFEKRTLSRALFVWTWIRAATKYPFRFAADHPVRAAIGAHAALEAEQRTEDLGPRPFYLDQAFPVGEEKGGFRPIVNPRSASNLATPLDLGLTIASMFESGPTTRSIFDLVNPGIAAVIDTARKQIDYGDNVVKTGTLEAAKANFLGIVGPYRDVKALADDAPSTLYRSGRGEYAKRRFGRGVIPFDVNVAEMHARGRREQGLPKDTQESLRAMVGEEKATAARVGVALPPEVELAVEWKVGIDAAVDRLRRGQQKRGDTQVPSGKRFKLTAKQKAAVAVDYFGKKVPSAKVALEDAYRRARTDEEFQQLYEDIRAEFLQPLEDWHRETGG